MPRKVIGTTVILVLVVGGYFLARYVLPDVSVISSSPVLSGIYFLIAIIVLIALSRLIRWCFASESDS